MIFHSKYSKYKNEVQHIVYYDENHNIQYTTIDYLYERFYLLRLMQH